MKRFIQIALDRAIPKILIEIEGGLIQNAPVDTGRLRNSIIARSTSEGITIFMVNYAKDVEFGFPAGTPIDVESLKGWAKRKLGDESLAYPIAKYLKKYGRAPNPFIREFFFNNFKQIVKKHVERELNEVLNK